jgi:signal peptidase I
MTRRRIALIALLVAAVALAPAPGLGALWRVYGPSMEPTITDGSLVVVDVVQPAVTGYRRGDIVILTPPGGRSEFPFDTMIKRVVGLPGERVTIDDGTVAVDGRRLAEPYLPRARSAMADVPGDPGGPAVEADVPAGTVFVLGDHRSASLDSTSFGPVPVDHLHGRVLFILRSDGIVAPPPSPLPGAVAASN